LIRVDRTSDNYTGWIILDPKWFLWLHNKTWASTIENSSQ
jgi:hypothetical protein